MNEWQNVWKQYLKLPVGDGGGVRWVEVHMQEGVPNKCACA